MIMDDSNITEELRIADERSNERRRVLEEFMIEEPIYKVPPLMPPVIVSRSEPVQTAIDLMDRTKSGCVLVVENERLLGIVTDRDVFRKTVVQRLDPLVQKIEEIMTPNPTTLQIDDPIAYAFRAMGIGGFRHIPLLDDQNKPVGSLSVQYLIKYMTDFFVREIMTMPPLRARKIAATREGA